MTPPAGSQEVGTTGLEDIAIANPAVGPANIQILQPPGSSYLELYRDQGLAAVKRVARETASERYDAGIGARERERINMMIETIPWRSNPEQHLIDAYLEYIIGSNATLSYEEFLAAGGVE